MAKVMQYTFENKVILQNGSELHFWNGVSTLSTNQEGSYNLGVAAEIYGQHYTGSFPFHHEPSISKQMQVINDWAIHLWKTIE